MIYVIRENSFFYGDDYDNYVGSAINAYFTDRAEAEAEYKRLEIEATRYIILRHQEVLYTANLSFLKELDAFVFACCKCHILHGTELEMQLPKCMQDDDLFEFVQRTGIQKYDLLEFEDDPIFYGIWLNREQGWLRYDRSAGRYLMYELSEESLFDTLLDLGYFMTFSEHDFVYEGVIEDMTDFPILFKQVLNELQWTKYDETEQKLKINGYHIHDIKMLNPLLKHPIFEVKTLSLSEVLQVEEQISEERQREYDAWETEYRAELAKNNPPPQA